MNLKYALFVGKNLFLILFSSILFLTPLRATTVLNETFNSTLPETWKVSPKGGATCVEGTLVLSSSDEVNKSTPAGYAVTKIESKSPLLNILQNNLVIKMSGLDIKGSAAAGIRVFQFLILSDKPDDKATSKLYLRISGDGNLMLFLKDATPTSAKAIYETKVSFPIKNLQLATTPKNITISCEDANGPKNLTIPLASDLTADWNSATTYLRLQSQRAPGAGDSQTTLNNLSIESTPAK